MYEATRFADEKMLYMDSKVPKSMIQKVHKMNAGNRVPTKSQRSHLIHQVPDLGGVTTLLVQVDDIIVIDNDEKETLIVKHCLKKEFEIKKLRKLKNSFSIQLTHLK